VKLAPLFTCCGEPIPAARLEVNPTARRCAACQARHEKLTGAL
jgi:RNA polymerase-binding transcription factor DksA